MFESSGSISDTSEDAVATRSAPPATNHLLSLYRRELTDKRDEISRLKQQLGGMREENEKLERALDMRRLNSYELDCDLREAVEKLESRERGRTHRKEELRTDKMRRSSDRGGYFLPDPYSYLDKYGMQSVASPASKGANSVRANPPPPARNAPGKAKLVKPLTYQKSSNLNDRWITHAPSKTSYQGIFQPHKTKGKQVAQPRKEDLIGKKHGRDKYLLSHQEASPDGSQLVTTLYKGNVNPTRSGGAQVRFTDTEVLQQCQNAMAFPHDNATQRQIANEDARNIHSPNLYRHHSMGSGKNRHDWSKAKLRMATLKDAKVKPDPNSSSHIRRATIDDAMLPSESRYFYLV